MNDTPYPWGKGTVATGRISSAGASAYAINIPAGKLRRYTHLQAQLTCTATVGNRRLLIQFAPGGVGSMYNVITANVTASQVGMITLGRDLPYSTTPRAGVITSPNVTANVAVYDSLPDVIFSNADSIIVSDSAAIDPAADSLYIFYSYVEWDA